MATKTLTRSMTYAELVSAIATNALNKGESITITDRHNLVLKVINSNTLEPFGSAVYQNSVMAAPMLVTIWYDVINDSILRIYEHTKNNDVSINVFNYSDTINLFPFDDIDWFGNIFTDVKLIDLSISSKISSSVLETMIIDANSNIIVFENVKWKGCYGKTYGNVAIPLPHEADLYALGDSIILGAVMEYGTYIDSMGALSITSATRMGLACQLQGQGGACEIIDCVFGDFVSINVTDNYSVHLIDVVTCFGNMIFLKSEGVTLEIVQMDLYSTVYVENNNIDNTKIGFFSIVTSTNGEVSNCFVGENCTFSPTSNQTGKTIQSISGTTYYLGESAGIMTLTPV